MTILPQSTTHKEQVVLKFLSIATEKARRKFFKRTTPKGQFKMASGTLQAMKDAVKRSKQNAQLKRQFDRSFVSGGLCSGH